MDTQLALLSDEKLCSTKKKLSRLKKRLHNYMQGHWKEAIFSTRSTDSCNVLFYSNVIPAKILLFKWHLPQKRKQERFRVK